MPLKLLTNTKNKPALSPDGRKLPWEYFEVTDPDRDRTIYISGPMTGIPDYNFPAFNAAAEEWRAKGWFIENPAVKGEIENCTWEDYLRIDMIMLARSGAIAMLPGWEQSPGATFENHIMQTLHCPVYDALSVVECPRG